MRVRSIGTALVVAGLIGTGAAHAANVPNMYVQHHLRVNGATDFKGRTFAQQGLRVRHGINADTLTLLKGAQIGGSLAVAGPLTSNGLNAGAGAILTTGVVQGGSLTLSGGATVTGSLTVAGNTALQAVSVGNGGLQVSGPFQASGGSFTGTLTASGAAFSGPIAAPNATFTHLSIANGGTVDFGGATLTNVKLATNASSLMLQSNSAGGTNGYQPLTITQAGKTASLSVASNGLLTISASGLTTPTLNVGGGLSAGALTVNGTATASTLTAGTLNANTVNSASGLTLNTAQITTQAYLNMGGNARIIGNKDMRGTCSASASINGVNTCQVAFTGNFSAPPVVVATPVGVDPAQVTGYSVQSSTGGFTISFRVSTAGNYTFNYIVEG